MKFDYVEPSEKAVWGTEIRLQNSAGKEKALKALLSKIKTPQAQAEVEKIKESRP